MSSAVFVVPDHPGSRTTTVANHTLESFTASKSSLFAHFLKEREESAPSAKMGVHDRLGALIASCGPAPTFWACLNILVAALGFFAEHSSLSHNFDLTLTSGQMNPFRKSIVLVATFSQGVIPWLKVWGTGWLSLVSVYCSIRLHLPPRAKGVLQHLLIHSFERFG